MASQSLRLSGIRKSDAVIRTRRLQGRQIRSYHSNPSGNSSPNNSKRITSIGGFWKMYRLFRSWLKDYVANIIIVPLHLRWRAAQLLDVEIGWLQMQRKLVQGQPGFGIHLRVDNLQRELHV